MAEGCLLLIQWPFLGKAEQTQKLGWDGLREKKNKCPVGFIVVRIPSGIGFGWFELPHQHGGMEARGFVILLP